MGMPDSNWNSKTLINAAASASGAGTAIVAGSTLIGIGQSSVAVLDFALLGATGGTLDVIVQSSVDAKQDGTGSWYDVVRIQLAAGAAAVRQIATLSRGFNKIAAVPNVTADSSATAPVLAINTIIPDALGNALRVVEIAGAGTTLGAAQTVKVGLSK